MLVPGVGDRVVVIRDGTNVMGNLIGRRGTVVEMTPTEFARYMVKLDCHAQELAFSADEIEGLSLLDILAESAK